MVGAVAFAAPGALATPTGGFVYDRRVIAELARRGWRVDYVDLGEGFPWPSGAQVAAAEARLAATPVGTPIIVDGLAFGALPDSAARLAAAHPLIALVHHPLALETGLSPPRAARLRESERAALAFARRVIVTSAFTARALASDYGVAADRIDVARPGSDRCAIASGARDGVIALLAVGAVTPRKGYDTLIAALAGMTDLPWRLTIVGDLARDPECAERLALDIRRHDLRARVDAVGAVSAERLEALYRCADVFALASRYEGYGMAYAEAVAHGLPVIGTTAGAIAETVPEGAGTLVDPDNVDAFRRALREVVGNAAERARMAARAWRVAADLPRWSDAAETFARAIERAAFR